MAVYSAFGFAFFFSLIAIFLIGFSYYFNKNIKSWEVLSAVFMKAFGLFIIQTALFFIFFTMIYTPKYYAEGAFSANMPIAIIVALVVPIFMLYKVVYPFFSHLFVPPQHNINYQEMYRELTIEQLYNSSSSG